MNIQKAIQVIDTVTDGIIDETINLSFFEKVLYGKLDQELYKHVISKWRYKEGDFFDFYMNSSDEVKRYILEGLGIEVESDKYPDYASRTMELIKKKKRCEVFPFETEVLHQYFLFGFNNSLEILKELSPSAWKTVEEAKIDRYGNYRNWTAFWSMASQEDKILLFKYIIELT